MGIDAKDWAETRFRRREGGDGMKDIRTLSDYEQLQWQKQVIREEIEEGDREIEQRRQTIHRIMPSHIR